MGEQTSITTGTVALLLNRVPSHPSKQQPYKFSEFSVLSVLSVDKNGSWCFESVDEIDMTCLQGLDAVVSSTSIAPFPDDVFI
jgi:hypothetical protein